MTPPNLTDAAQDVFDTVLDGVRDNARNNGVSLKEYWTADTAIELYAGEAFAALPESDRQAVNTAVVVWLRAGEHDAP